MHGTSERADAIHASAHSYICPPSCTTSGCGLGRPCTPRLASTSHSSTTQPVTRSRRTFSIPFPPISTALAVQVDGEYVWTNVHRQGGEGKQLSLSGCVAAQLGDSVDVYLPHHAPSVEVCVPWSGDGGVGV